MWGYWRLPKSLQWISFPIHKSFAFLIVISHSSIYCQYQNSSKFLNDGFVPSFGGRIIWASDIIGLSSGERLGRASNSPESLPREKGHGKENLQSSFSALFDFSIAMPGMEVELPILKKLQKSCSREELFYSQNPHHKEAAMQVMKLLMEQNTAQDVIHMAASLRDMQQVNPQAWIRGVMMAATFRKDLQGLRKPAMVEVMPSMWINTRAIRDVRRQANFEQQSRTCTPVDGSVGRDNGLENKLWYWREDIMVNSHHWYWHLSFPVTATMPREDRRGELFYFMHHTLLGRYHAERLANALPPVPPLNLQRGTIIREGYNPHLTDANSGLPWSPRPANVLISDIMSTAIANSPFFISVDNRTIETNRILESIGYRKFFSAYHGEIPADNVQGIDFLGDMVEASAFSINPEYYGYFGIHNSGHVLLSLALDPVQELGIPPGPMGDFSTAMRDIVFYPYHVFLDDIFDAHKRTLPPYQLTGGDWPLVWKGVEILDVIVQAPKLPYNHLQTFWNEKQYELGRGLDFNRSVADGPVLVCVKHLDHLDFQYQITVESRRPRKATFRIHLSPRYDEKGKRYLLEEQRRRFFILDIFTTTLKPGVNKIIRNSADSLLTIDFPASYRALQSNVNLELPDCGCGWPHHLLIPKGTPSGMPFDLFVMVTDGKLDGVRTGGRPPVCHVAPILCGVVNELYPDARPMGYPFDRPIYPNNNINPLDPQFDDIPGPILLEEWISIIPNMATTKIIITHFDELRMHENSYLAELEGAHQGKQFEGDRNYEGFETSIFENSADSYGMDK